MCFHREIYKHRKTYHLQCEMVSSRKNISIVFLWSHKWLFIQDLGIPYSGRPNCLVQIIFWLVQCGIEKFPGPFDRVDLTIQQTVVVLTRQYILLFTGLFLWDLIMHSHPLFEVINSIWMTPCVQSRSYCNCILQRDNHFKWINGKRQGWGSK